MGVAYVVRYRINPGLEEETFREAARHTFALASNLGAVPSLRWIPRGRDATGTRSATYMFRNAVERDEWAMAIVGSEHGTEHELNRLVRGGRLTVVGHTFVDEVPATEEIPSIAPVQLVRRFRVLSGRFDDAEDVTRVWKHACSRIGVEAHVFTSGDAELDGVVLSFSEHALSTDELEANLARRREYGRRVDSQCSPGWPGSAREPGALIPIDQFVSTLIVL